MTLHTHPDSPLAPQIEEIRAYTAAHPELSACHHFGFDLRLGVFERADYVVMGVNPGETADDLATSPGPVEESSLVDYRAGVDSPSRDRWFSQCREMLGTDRLALSELVFWSSPNVPALVRRIGPLDRSPHVRFCRQMNDRLLEWHRPAAVVLPGLSLVDLTARLYSLSYVRSVAAPGSHHRLIEHYQRAGVPWVFTKHWSGAFGFSGAQRQAIRDYVKGLAS